jgi:excisionase family DNA binding protein
MNLLTEREAARMLKVSTRTVARLRAQGKLRYIPTRPIRIDYDDLVNYVKAEKVQCQNTLLQRLYARTSTRGSSKTQKLGNFLSNSLTSTQAQAEECRVASALGQSLALRQKWRLQHGKPPRPR